MKHVKMFLAIIVVMQLISCHGRKSSEGGIVPNPDNGGIKLPDGFSAVVVADSLGLGRHLTVNSNGDIYMALLQLHNGKGIVALRDTTGDGKADVIKYFGRFHGTGIKLHNGYLYFGADTAVVRYPMREGKLLPDTTAEVIAYGFENRHQHEAKSITFDGEGNLYVNVGAPANACQTQMRTPGSPGMDPCPLLEKFGGIWQFKDDVPWQQQVEVGHRYATGLRNCVAIDWNFTSNHLYVVQHGRDQLHEFFPQYYSEDEGVNLPAEEFFEVDDQDNFGWPYCYYDPFKKKKMLAPEYGGNGEIVGRCEDAKDPIMTFPAHTAPNALLFYTGSLFPEEYKNGAFIAFHGSWNRAPQEQKGYYVAFVPFKDGKPSSDWKIFANGFAGVNPIMSPGDAKYRPTGLAQGPDGSLYVSDSNVGRIWRIMYNK